MALKDKKLSKSLDVDKALAEAVRGRLREGKLSCAAAISLAEARGIDPLSIGRTADSPALITSPFHTGIARFQDRTGCRE